VLPRDFEKFIVRSDRRIDYYNVRLLEVAFAVTAEVKFNIGKFLELTNRIA
jgi:hypothetical protein